MRGSSWIACCVVVAACSSSVTNEAPNNSGGSSGTGGSATGGSSGAGGAGGSGGTSPSGGQGGSGGLGGTAGATGGSGGAAGAGGSDASLGGSAGAGGSDASVGGTGGTGGTGGSATGGTSGSGGSGGTGGSATGGTSGSGGSGGTSGSDAGDAATGGSAGDASTDAAADASDGAAGSDAGVDAQSDASGDAGDAASDAPVGDAGACPAGLTGGDGTVHYPRWKIAGDARPDSEFTATANVVIDHTTCLMWHRTAATAGSSWDAANTLCDSSTVDGYTDWRLPTRAELISLTDFTRANPSINPTIFPGVSNSTSVGARFWSSTSLASDNTKRWSVLHGGYGQVTYFVTTDLHAVRCVRGTGAPSGSRFDTSTSGVVKDTETKLVWEAAPPNQVYTLASAATYCSGLGLGGGGWRMPTIRELSTLPDPLLASPALPAAAFTSVNTWYWSSTPTYNVNPAQNWAVLIGPGFSQPDGASLPYSNMRVRCVR